METESIDRGRRVHFELSRSNSKSPLRGGPPVPDEKKTSGPFITLGMRQYTMWPIDKPQFTIPREIQTIPPLPTGEAVDEEEKIARILKQLLPSLGVSQPSPPSLTPENFREMLDAALKEHAAAEQPALAPSPFPNQPEVRDINVSTCLGEFMKEVASSPIHVSKSSAFVDKASSPKVNDRLH